MAVLGCSGWVGTSSLVYQTWLLVQGDSGLASFMLLHMDLVSAVEDLRVSSAAEDLGVASSMEDCRSASAIASYAAASLAQTQLRTPANQIL